MTVCIAVGCDCDLGKNPKVIFVSDFLLSLGYTSAEVALKIRKLGKSWSAMFAGNDISHASGVLNTAQDTLKKNEKITGFTAAEALSDSYHLVRRAQPQPQPPQTSVNCHSPRATQHSPLPQAPQPAPSPQTPLPPTAAEFAQQVMAGLPQSLRSDPVGPTGEGQAPQPAPARTSATRRNAPNLSFRAQRGTCFSLLARPTSPRLATNPS
jgi:hypothetical protein